MGNPRGFLKHQRELPKKIDTETRLRNYKEIYQPFNIESTVNQAARCMDCGIPFCHNGCPLGNIIPEFNDAVYEEDWEKAFLILSNTNNFPEFTGRICPAPCEAACVLNIHKAPVTIEHIEKSIAEVAFERGLIKPRPPVIRSGKKVAVVGSGPAGLAAAAQMNKAGHLVTVFERSDRIGGLLRYGIPDFKLEKWVVERRVALMEAEGIRFQTNAYVGRNVDSKELTDNFDAIILCGGSTTARDLNIPGRESKGVHLAMEFLEQNNRKIAGDFILEQERLSARGKHVVVIGGGDTGADCVGTSNRHGAASVTQIELLSKPPIDPDPSEWPNWPMMLRTSSSHEEGCERQWAILTKAFKADENGSLKALELVDIEWTKDPETGRYKFQEIEGSLRQIPCEMAFLAIGFTGPEKKGMLEQMDVELDERGNVKTDNYQTSNPKVFSAGDMRRGQSLVVWAISEGREAARAADIYLMGSSQLESKAQSYFLQQ